LVAVPISAARAHAVVPAPTFGRFDHAGQEFEMVEPRQGEPSASDFRAEQPRAARSPIALSMSDTILSAA
jgi:hypothetical protein